VLTFQTKALCGFTVKKEHLNCNGGTVCYCFQARILYQSVPWPRSAPWWPIPESAARNVSTAATGKNILFGNCVALNATRFRSFFFSYMCVKGRIIHMCRCSMEEGHVIILL